LVGVIELERKESLGVKSEKSLGVDSSSTMRLMRDKNDVFFEQIVEGEKKVSARK